MNITVLIESKNQFDSTNLTDEIYELLIEKFELELEHLQVNVIVE